MYRTQLHFQVKKIVNAEAKKLCELSNNEPKRTFLDDGVKTKWMTSKCKIAQYGSDIANR